MTDLSEIFRQRNIVNPIASFAKQSYQALNPSPYRSSSNLQFSKQPYLYSPYKEPNNKLASPYNGDLSVGQQSRKRITFNNMQKEVSWFQSKNMIEWLIKIVILAILLVPGFYLNYISFNVGLCIFVFCFMYLGLFHNVFGANIRNWVFFSLISTTFVLSHQIFTLLINKINPKIAGQLYYTGYSLVPAAYITFLITIMYNSLSILTQFSPRSISENLLTYPRDLLEIFIVVYRLRRSIIQNYLIMLSLTVLISFLLTINLPNQEDRYNFQLAYCVLNPYVLLCELLTFCICIIIVHFIMKVISNTVSKFVISILYNEKNPDTKVPIILQILRINPNDTFEIREKSKFANPLDSLMKLLKFDFIRSSQRNLSRQQLENMYKHSLCWIHHMLSINQQALKTKILYSTFYNTYFDIFKQFAELELRRCSSSLFEISHSIGNLNMMMSKPKSLKQDLFYYFKILRKQFQIWGKAIQCCRMLRITDQILQILSLGQVQRQLWVSSPIGNNLNQIRDKTSQLKQDRNLNPAIRHKMHQYFNKTNRILKSNRY